MKLSERLARLGTETAVGEGPMRARLVLATILLLAAGGGCGGSGCPFGPVSPGEVSTRRRVSPGTYRLWAQAFSSSPEAQAVRVDIGVWGEQCDRPPL